MKKSLEKILAVLRGKRLDAFLVTDPINIRYLTGFRGHDSALLVSGGGTVLITDFRYAEEAESLQALSDDFTVELRTKSFSESLKKIRKKIKFRNLAFESRNVAYQRFMLLQDALKRCAFVPQKSLVEDLRVIKEPREVELIQKALAVSKKAYRELVKNIRIGRTEAELAARYDHFVRIQSIAKNSFETIVAIDEHSSMPHAEISEAKARKGSRILIDFGATHEGYNCDLTRMVVLGKIDATFRKIYAIVETSQKIAIEHIRAGADIRAIDALSRNYIEDKGFGKFFGHSLGHGIGLSVHEDPTIHAFNKNRFEAGMVVTLEPGIYIPGWGGVRLEDMVLVTKTGCEVLSDDIDKRF